MAQSSPLHSVHRSVSFAQTGTGNQGQNNQNQSQQGTGPNNAYTSAGQGGSIGQGQQQWYAFQYAGDNSQIPIRLLNASNLQFSVWTLQDIQNANGNFGATANPVGRSSASDQFGGDQYWTGSFNTPGTYYVMVERTNGGQASGSGQYSLQITGSGVTFGGANKQQGQANNQGQSGSNATGNNTSSSNPSAGSNNAQGGTAPSTLPVTGGEMASVLPMLIGGIGALSVGVGALLRRRK